MEEETTRTTIGESSEELVFITNATIAFSIFEIKAEIRIVLEGREGIFFIKNFDILIFDTVKRTKSTMGPDGPND